MTADHEQKAGRGLKPAGAEVKPKSPTELLNQIRDGLPPKILSIRFQDPDDATVVWGIAHTDKPGLARNGSVTKSSPHGPFTKAEITTKSPSAPVTYYEAGAVGDPINAGSLVTDALNALSGSNFRPSKLQVGEFR
ncbi:MAG TPA: hypothetical protein VNA13_01100 [Xanthomonadales bacterium]|nr:hypothetical protein [Xanthomonadales bacterium]